MTKVSRQTRSPAMLCPHCSNRTSIRSSWMLSTLLRQVRYRCENDECGCIFLAHVEVVRIIVPSATPHPDVNLPDRYVVTNATPLPANDVAPIPANDDGDDAAIAAPLDPMTP